MGRNNYWPRAASLRLLLGLGTISSGCAMKEVKYTPPSCQSAQTRKNTALVVGIDGWMSGNMHKLAKRLGEECGIELVVNSVHFWENNMDEIRQANREGRPIILLGYSCGADQARITSAQCEREGIGIDKVILQDPFFTFYSKLNPTDFPKNVREIASYFSTDLFDLMFWARGNPEDFKYASKVDSRYKPPRFVRGSHMSCFFWENAKENLKKEIEETKKANYRRLNEK